jgi:quercetin dioxygenase-like cupin family protein
VSNPTEAYLCRTGESELRWMGETSTHFLASGARTGGAFALVEERAKRGVSVPLHRHDEDMESFYVLEGEISFFLGDQAAMRAAAGAFAHIPGGTVHGFRIESETARYLILTTPRHAEFYRAISAPSPLTAIDGSVISKACQEFGIEFVGPLPPPE